jgi:hypothetical protein
MWWSDQVFRLLGHAPRAFPPSFDRFIDAVHPLDRARVNDAIHDALQQHPEGLNGLVIYARRTR